jgi:hypothetical protein
MSDINNNKTNFVNNSIPTSNFFHECINLAIDGFLFRGITPSDHYYRFSQSFPRALTLSSNFLLTSKQFSNHLRPTKNISSFNISLPEENLSLTRHVTNIPSESLSTNGTVLTETSKSSECHLNCLEMEVYNISERMKKSRLKDNRPSNLSKMTIKQILDEKTDMQHELLKFETKYSKPTKSEQKKIMKPLYDYYRQLKRLLQS